VSEHKHPETSNWARTGERRSSDSGVYFVRRQEEKFEMGIATAAFLREEIARHLPLYEFYPGYSSTYVTTIYFDTADYLLYKGAERSYDDNVKIRVKEYYYRRREGALFDGARAGGAAGNGQETNGLYLCFPHCFVEVKRRQQGTVYKWRLQLPKDKLAALFEGADVWESAIDGSAPAAPGSPAAGPGLRESYGELRSYLSRYEVLATSIVNYRRSVYQRSEEELRITFDDEIAVYPALPGLYGRPGGNGHGSDFVTLTREVLGAPTRRYEKVILEIKCPGQSLPEWLQRVLRNLSSKQLSKFTTSVRFLSEAGLADSKDLPFQGPRGNPCAPGGLSADDTRVSSTPIER
jgi:hypothetical protein